MECKTFALKYKLNYWSFVWCLHIFDYLRLQYIIWYISNCTFLNVFLWNSIWMLKLICIFKMKEVGGIEGVAHASYDNYLTVKNWMEKNNTLKVLIVFASLLSIAVSLQVRWGIRPVFCKKVLIITNKSVQLRFSFIFPLQNKTKFRNSVSFVIYWHKRRLCEFWVFTELLGT